MRCDTIPALSTARNQKDKKTNEKLKTKTEMLRRNGPVIKILESVLMPQDSLWCERFVKEVGFEPGLREREIWMVSVAS